MKIDVLPKKKSMKIMCSERSCDGEINKFECNRVKSKLVFEQ